MKTLTLAAILTLTLAPSATAQTPAPAAQAARKPSLQQTVRQDLLRIQRGTRSGQITAAERRRLGTSLRALRNQIQTLRQAGTPPSPAERTRLRAELRRLSRAIAVATHNRRIKK
jgi:hypothetical protein